MTNTAQLDRSSHLQPNPIYAWSIIGGFTLLTTLCLLARFSNILQIAFPVSTFFIGIFLYFRYPILYLGFNWWIWFLSPLVSRLVEYQNNLVDSGFRLIILSPYLVTICTGISFFRHIPKLYKREGLPFFLAFISLIYALLIGIAQGNSLVKVAQGILSWLPGIFLGFHLLANWQSYPAYRENTQKVFYWGVLVMGIYGVVQYMVAPDWDKFWLTNAQDLQFCCGWPEPFMIRVWSTLNYPFTFGYAMMACLLLLLGRQNLASAPAIISGLLSFLLSQVRGAWFGFTIGLIIFFLSLNSRLKFRLIATIFIIIICLIPLASSGPIVDVIASRISTLSSGQEDGSAMERQRIYAELFDIAIGEIIGKGMGGISIVDAGLIDILNTLGWFGLLFYGVGIYLLFYRLFIYAEARFDPFMNASRSIVASIFVTIPFNNSTILLPGVLFWGFGGMVLAADRYYCYQKNCHLNNRDSRSVGEASACAERLRQQPKYAPSRKV
jgi:O-Antigen ligase